MARGTGVFNKDSLRSLRLARGLSAARLGALVGTSKSMILAYESGKHVPEAERARALADALGVSLPHLVPWFEGLTGTGDSPLQDLVAEIGISANDLRILLDGDDVGLRRAWVNEPVVTIRMLRRRSGLTVARAAEKTGIGLSTYRRIETEAMFPVRGRAGVLTRLAEVLHTSVPQVKRSVEYHPSAVRRQFEVSQILARLMEQYCGQGKVPAVQQDDPDLVQLAALIRQPLGPLSRIVEHELVRYQRLLKHKVRYTLESEFPEWPTDDEMVKRALNRVEGQIRQAPYRSAAHISKFLCDGLTSRQWRSFSMVMARLAMSERPEATGVSENQEPELWPALRGCTHEGRSLIREPSSPTHEPATGTGRFYFLTPSGFRYYEAARTTYEYLYPRIVTYRLPIRREPHWRRPIP
ncbi:helix-turn-helix domain-containing protein [Streptomyces sp. NPDC000927]|uniref:helix-turn-helix domain-containing protein n=1 Tax=Streptomyces sp. NPDC000927 TaxID=3154371 RepID=UPI003330583F